MNSLFLKLFKLIDFNLGCYSAVLGLIRNILGDKPFSFGYFRHRFLIRSCEGRSHKGIQRMVFPFKYLKVDWLSSLFDFQLIDQFDVFLNVFSNVLMTSINYGKRNFNDKVCLLLFFQRFNQ